MNAKQKFLLVMLAASVLGLGAQETNLPVVRYGLFVGAGQGGEGRAILQYAVKDAETMREVLTDLGGIAPQREILLKNPDAAAVLAGFTALGNKISQDTAQARRVEVLFYYSGHSDDSGLLLGRERLSYKTVRESLGRLPADIRIAILDSCASGAFARTKGGTMRPPFLVDETSKMTGHAYLTSSSETEASQESDRIGGSFFTHYLVSGLRGAADATRDGKITLNELYHHAFQNTLERTEDTQAGPQHPSYDIQLTGTGDLVLTDIQSFTSRLRCEDTLSGRLFVRTEAGVLAAEVEKGPGPLVLALPAGVYKIQLVQAKSVLKTTVTLISGQDFFLKRSQMQDSRLERSTPRGDTPADTEPQPITAFKPGSAFGLGLFGWNWWWNQSPGSTPGWQITLFFGASEPMTGGQINAHVGWIDDALTGVQISGLGGLVGGNLDGLQVAGVFNWTGGQMRGLQVGGLFNHTVGAFDGAQWSGLYNWSSHLQGYQAAGLFNVAGYIHGVQTAPLFNLSTALDGVQIGLLNVTGPGRGLQVGLINISTSAEVLPLGLINLGPKAWLHGRYAYDMAGESTGELQWGWASAYSYLNVRTNTETLKVFDASLGLGWHLEGDPLFADFDLAATAYRFKLHQDQTTAGLDLRPAATVRTTLGLHLGLMSLVTGLTLTADPWGQGWAQDSGRSLGEGQFSLAGWPIPWKNRLFFGLQL